MQYLVSVVLLGFVRVASYFVFLESLPEVWLPEFREPFYFVFSLCPLLLLRL